MKRSLTPTVVFIVLAAAMLLVFAGAPGAVQAALPRLSQSPQEAAQAALTWLLQTHQNDDGGFASFSQGANQAPSDAGGTVDALLAVASAGGDSQPLLAYLTDHAADVLAYAQQDGSRAGKLVWALVEAGQDPRSFAGQDYAAVLQGHYGPEGAYSVENAFGQALATIGASAVGDDVPQGALDWLTQRQAVDGELAGSWDDGFGTAGNPDATALAMLALFEAGTEVDDPALSSALAFLEATQLPSAGWEYGPGFGENVNSTALVTLSLAKMGQNPQGEEWSVDGTTPLDALVAWQGESGAFQADFGQGRSDDFFSTVQALQALAAVDSGQVHTDGSEAATIGGGDSALPYIMIVLVVVLLAVTFFWIRRGGR